MKLWVSHRYKEGAISMLKLVGGLLLEAVWFFCEGIELVIAIWDDMWSYARDVFWR